MTEKKILPRVRQAQVVDKPFAITSIDGLDSWQRWTGTGFALGKWNDSQFQQWNNDLKQWTDITFKREDGWRKIFRRNLIFDKEYELEIWDKETKQKVMSSVLEVEVQFTGGIEGQLQNKIADEKKRGSDPLNIFWMLNMKRTGDEPRDVEYTISFEKAKTSTSDVSDTKQEFKINIPTEEPDIRQQIIDAIKHQTGALEASQIQAYKTQLIEQIDKMLKDNGITDENEANRIFDNHIAK